MQRKNVIVVISEEIEVFGNFKKMCESKGFPSVYAGGNQAHSWHGACLRRCRACHYIANSPANTPSHRLFRRHQRGEDWYQPGDYRPGPGRAEGEHQRRVHGELEPRQPED